VNRKLVKPKFELEEVRTPLWERIRLSHITEPLSQFRAFEIWRALGSDERTFSSAALAAAVSQVTVRRWAAEWRWLERAAAFDEAVSASTRKQIEQRIAERSTVWLAREEFTREEGYDLFLRGLELIKQMLAYPLTRMVKETISEDGTQIIQIYEPAKWTHASVTALTTALFQLAHMSIGIAPGSRLVDNIDFENLPEPVLEALAAGRPVDLRRYSRNVLGPPRSDDGDQTS
jgi:hypothetical protein